MKCLKVEDALSYLDVVKERFSGQGAIYTDFLDVMREFKMQSIGTEVVIRRVRELFEGHPDLIIGFNNFIPQGYRMDAPGPRSCSTVKCRSSVISGVENVSPPKKVSANSKPQDGSNEWTPTGLSSKFELADPGSVSPVLSNTMQPMDYLPFRSTNSSHPEMHQFSSNAQNLCGSAFCEASTFRGSYPLSPSSVTHAPIPVSHAYQQQKQAQSFNHALHYVNKIKNRFQGIPDAYKRFLDILQWYQREQRHSDAVRRKHAEKQVYQDVAKLFDGQEDLLQEFSQFLPESTGVTTAVTESFIGRKIPNQVPSSLDNASSDLNVPIPQVITRVSENINLALSPCRQRSDSNSCNSSNLSVVDSRKLKRLAPAPLTPVSHSGTGASGATKKARPTVRDVSVTDVNQIATGLDISLLHKIRSLLDVDSSGSGRSYQTFLQTLSLYNRNVISADELLESTRPLFPRNIDVWRKFCDMVAAASPLTSQDPPSTTQTLSSNQPSTCDSLDKDVRSSPNNLSLTDLSRLESSPSAPQNHVNSACNVGEAAQKRLDLDFSKLRSCGVSYRALPSNFPQSKCSGRLKCLIAKEVLNDTYISFSSLTSEDSQFVSSKKNQYEEHMYRVEDERYEVDMVTELNRAALQNLVVIKRRMDQMSREELSRFVLDDNLGGTSAILMRKAIHRVYGDKAGDVIYGLKACPSTVVPVVIQRMRQKDSEWREAIRVYQRSWEEQDARNYLRSLDHQGATFKQRDAPSIRSKTMISQIESIARDDSACCNLPDPIGTMISASLTQPCLTTRTDLNTPGTFGSALINVNEGYKEPGSPHLSLVYPLPSVRNALLQDAASLIIHHVKRQSNTSKEDKRTMKFLMRMVVQDFFMADRFPMSDDEEDEDEDELDQKDDTDEIADELVPSDEGTRVRATRQSRLRRTKDYRKPDTMDTYDRSTDVMFSSTRNPDARLGSPLSCDYGPSQVACEVDPCVSDADMKNCLHANYITPGATSSMMEIGQSPPNAIRDWEAIAHSVTFPREEHYSLLYGNNHWYSFLRLHHLLLCRLYLFRSRSAELAMQAEAEKNAAPVQAAEVLRLKRYTDVDASDFYNRALILVKDLLDGGEDVTKYEDRLRNMFDIYAYPWFTLDRLVINIVRQLHALASGDELSQRLTALHRSWMCGSPSADATTCNVTPFPLYRYNHLSAVQPTVPPHYGGVRGPLCARVCRLTNESVYRAQALEVISAFAGQTGVATNAFNQPSTTGHTTSSQNNGTFSANTSGNLPNCYAMVMLNEASTLLIRLVSPASSSPEQIDLGAAIPGSCVLTASVPAPAANSDLSPTVHVSAITKQISSNASPRHWFDYLMSHLVWTLGHVPRNVATYIRPVFLYRTVRRCVRALTRRAYRRRQQQLVDTGDTQPEELLVKVALHPTRMEENPHDTVEELCDAANTESVVSPKNNLPGSLSSTTGNFEHDVWEFMCHVFKSDLTRKELFRDTFSSDCMQFTNRMTARTNPRAYKINWSVGSYGIFIRRKRQTVSIVPRIQKWRDFHARWLEFAHTKSVESNSVCSLSLNAPIDTSALCCKRIIEDTTRLNSPAPMLAAEVAPLEGGYLSPQLLDCITEGMTSNTQMGTSPPDTNQQSFITVGEEVTDVPAYACTPSDLSKLESESC